MTYVPNVITTCAIIHNLLLGQTTEDVDRLLRVLQAEGWRDEGEDEDPIGVVQEKSGNFELGRRPCGAELQHALGMYLSAQRGLLP